MINVPQDAWLTYLFKLHSPHIRDIGDQREPWNIIICSCDPFIHPLPKEWKEPNAYQKHFMEILQNEYFSRLGK